MEKSSESAIDYLNMSDDQFEATLALCHDLPTLVVIEEQLNAGWRPLYDQDPTNSPDSSTNSVDFAAAKAQLELRFNMLDERIDAVLQEKSEQLRNLELRIAKLAERLSSEPPAA